MEDPRESLCESPTPYFYTKLRPVGPKRYFLDRLQFLSDVFVAVAAAVVFV